MTSPVEGLAALAAARAELDDRELRLIDQARRQGATWAEVAAALGLGSRQAAEQRRQRLAAVSGRSLDAAYGPGLAPLRTAVAALAARIRADRRWDASFGRAVLVRETLQAAVDAPPGSLFALAGQAVADLDDVDADALPRPVRSALTDLRAALSVSTPH